MELNIYFDAHLIQLLRSPKTSQSVGETTLSIKMAAKSTDRIRKKWVVSQLQHGASLKTLAGAQRFQKALMQKILEDEATEPQSVRQYLAKLIIYSRITFTHKISSS
jgi:hypothetical protein